MAEVSPSTPDDGLRDFRAVYRAHYGLVWHALHRFGVAATLVDDAVQDVFVAAYRRRASYRGPSPKPWLYGIARRVASNYRRSTRRRTQRDQSLPRPTRPAVDDEALAAIEGLERYLAGLRAEDRELLLLSELEGMTGPELASVTGRNVQTIYTRVRKLKVELGRQVGGHVSGLERVRRERPQATARSWSMLLPLLPRAPLAPAGAITATTTSGWSAAGWSGTGWGWMVGLAGAASLAVVVTASPAADRPERTDAPAEARGSVGAPARVQSTPEGAEELASSVVASGTLVGEAAPAVAPSPSPTESSGAPARRRDSTPQAPTEDGLGVETELLRRASTELAAGHADAALRITGEHGRRFPRSSLADLRTAVRIEALCGLGKAAQARGEAQVFLREHPQSPVAERIERACRSPS